MSYHCLYNKVLISIWVFTMRFLHFQNVLVKSLFFIMKALNIITLYIVFIFIKTSIMMMHNKCCRKICNHTLMISKKNEERKQEMGLKGEQRGNYMGKIQKIASLAMFRLSGLKYAANMFACFLKQTQWTFVICESSPTAATTQGPKPSSICCRWTKNNW